MRSITRNVCGAASVALLLLLASLSIAGPEDDYTLGPRDVIKVTVWGQEDLSKEYPVDSDGFVAFPLVGRVQAAGLTTKQFANRLTELLEKDFLVNPQVLVSVKNFLSKKVYVMGEVERRGAYYLSKPTTLLDILSEAGGLSKSASRQLVLVRSHGAQTSGKGGNTILRLNVDKIQAGDVAENVRLEDEDMILVSKGHAYFVLGEVKAGGTFPLDKETSMLEAITLAGGFTSTAAPAGVKLVRRGSDGKEETLAVDLSGTIPKDRDIKIRDGDTLLVPKGNTFFVFGEVRKPGAYQLEKETTILEGITIAGGFTEKAAPGRTRVIRNTTKGQQVIHIDMNDVLKRGQREKAIPLRENDVVVVPESFF